MNVERLFTVAKAIAEDLNETNMITLVSQVNSTLQQIISQPQNGTHLQSLTNYLNSLKEKSESSKMNDFPPLWVQVTEELGFSPFGTHLYQEINEAIQQNQLTVPEAKKNIDQILNKLSTRKQALDQMLNSFNTLEIGSEELEEGACELGVLIPRNYVENDLNKLSEEFENMSSMLSVFDEIATGSRSGFKVNSIASSDFGLYIAAAAPVALLISQSIDKLMSAYRNYWEVKKIKKELEDKNVPTEQLHGLNEHIETIVKNSIDEIIAEIIPNAHKNIDNGRKNEITTELKLSLNKLANRLDRGFNIEVRVNPPEIEEYEDEEEENSTTEDNTDIRIFEEILKHTQNFSYISNESEPIVFLTENIEDLKTKTTKKKATKKTTKKVSKKS